MNTNSNLYTILYTSIIVILVAAILAFASMALKSKQDANVKAETISQMLTAAKLFEKEDLAKLGNDQVLAEYSKNIKEAYTIDGNGKKVADLKTDVNSIELIDNLKAQNDLLKKNKVDNYTLPVYVFNKDGQDVTVVPAYGAGLWGPVWGYLAFAPDMKTIVGAYFDHDSETPGLGAKIKDDPSFRAEFEGKVADFDTDAVFSVVKGGTDSANGVDAITGATMTSKGLGNAISAWLNAYKPFFKGAAASQPVQEELPAQTDSAAVAVPVTE